MNRGMLVSVLFNDGLRKAYGMAIFTLSSPNSKGAGLQRVVFQKAALSAAKLFRDSTGKRMLQLLQVRWIFVASLR